MTEVSRIKYGSPTIYFKPFLYPCVIIYMVFSNPDLHYFTLQIKDLGEQNGDQKVVKILILLRAFTSFTVGVSLFPGINLKQFRNKKILFSFELFRNRNLTKSPRLRKSYKDWIHHLNLSLGLQCSNQ